MKGLTKLPNKNDMSRAAHVIQQCTGPLPARKLALFSQWSRLDPRFAEIMVRHLADSWSAIPGGDLLKALNSQPWPRAILVLLWFAERLVPRTDRKHFQCFARALADSLDLMPTTTPQLFFIPLQRPNSVVMDAEVSFRSKPYLKAGYIGSQSLLSRAQWPREQTFLRPNERLRILKNLLRQKEQITVNDYREACKGMVSRRQAQRDLAQTADYSGFTQRRRYRARSIVEPSSTGKPLQNRARIRPNGRACVSAD